MQTQQTQPQQGARSAGLEGSDRRKRKAPLAWLPWAALALIALLGIASYLVATNVTDENDRGGIDLVDDEAAEGSDPSGSDTGTGTGTGGSGAGTGTGSATTSGAGGPATTSAGTAAGAAGGGTAAGGSLTAGGQALLPLPAQGLAAYAGQAAQGRGVLVESVVADEGFWVGSAPGDRVFVFLTPQARTSAGESPFKVEAGQRIDLDGTVVATPAGEREGVTAEEGAQELAQQGHLIEATRIALAG